MKKGYISKLEKKGEGKKGKDRHKNEESIKSKERTGVIPIVHSQGGAQMIRAPHPDFKLTKGGDKKRTGPTRRVNDPHGRQSQKEREAVQRAILNKHRNLR